MFGHTFYHGTIRRYVVLFGTLFNDIYINRPDPKHNITHTVKVPVAYGPRDKVLARLTADPNLDRKPAIVLPRISFEMTDLRYAPERKLNTIGKRYVRDGDNANNIKYQYNPVPYDINFSLSVIVKNTDDGLRIIEQILPFFTPEWTSTVHLIPEMDITMDIPIILNDVSVDDQYEGAFDERRALVWNLSFTLKGYLYGPVRKAGIIKFANSSIFGTLGSTQSLSSITTQPGLLANGAPTSDINQTISRDMIYPDDDFGYIVQFTEPGA
jgi:hypothetical protein